MQGLYPALSMLFPFEPENKGHGLKALKPSEVNWSKKNQFNLLNGAGGELPPSCGATTETGEKGMSSLPILFENRLF